MQDGCQDNTRNVWDIFLQHESWGHYLQPETKTTSKEWQHPNSPKHKRFCAQPLLGKLMLMPFRDSKGAMINSSSHCDLLVNYMKQTYWPKDRGLPISSVLLLRDALPHTTHATVTKIKDLYFECLPHPRYSPDHVPSGFQQALQEWLCRLPKNWFFSRGIEALVQRWNNVLNIMGTMLKN